MRTHYTYQWSEDPEEEKESIRECDCGDIANHIGPPPNN